MDDARYRYVACGEDTSVILGECKAACNDIVIIPFGNNTSFMIALVADVFAEANRAFGRELLRWEILSEAFGAGDETQHLRSPTLILIGDDIQVPHLDKLQRATLRRLCRAAPLICSAGGAVGILAELRLLDGRLVSAPTGLISALSERFPMIDFKTSPIQRDGRYFTCAGGVKMAEFAITKRPRRLS